MHDDEDWYELDEDDCCDYEDAITGEPSWEAWDRHWARLAFSIPEHLERRRAAPFFYDPAQEGRMYLRHAYERGTDEWLTVWDDLLSWTVENPPADDVPLWEDLDLVHHDGHLVPPPPPEDFIERRRLHVWSHRLADGRPVLCVLQRDDRLTVRFWGGGGAAVIEQLFEADHGIPGLAAHGTVVDESGLTAPVWRVLIAVDGDAILNALHRTAKATWLRDGLFEVARSRACRTAWPHRLYEHALAILATLPETSRRTANLMALVLTLHLHGGDWPYLVTCPRVVSDLLVSLHDATWRVATEWSTLGATLVAPIVAALVGAAIEARLPIASILPAVPRRYGAWDGREDIFLAPSLMQRQAAGHLQWQGEPPRRVPVARAEDNADPSVMQPLLERDPAHVLLRAVGWELTAQPTRARRAWWVERWVHALAATTGADDETVAAARRSALRHALAASTGSDGLCILPGETWSRSRW